MHRKHGIDRGTEVTDGSGPGKGIPVGSGVPPLEKLVKTYFQRNCTAPDYKSVMKIPQLCTLTQLAVTRKLQASPRMRNTYPTLIMMLSSHPAFLHVASNCSKQPSSQSRKLMTQTDMHM